MPFLSQAHLTTYLFFYIETVELSGVDDGVDGSDVEESDVDDVGVDGDEFFKYWTLLKIAGDGVGGNEGLGIDADPEGVSVTVLIEMWVLW